MDKSFQGLVLSLIVHAVLVWLYLHAPAQPLSRNEATEVEYISKAEANKKMQQFVTETEKQDVFKALKDRADYLSKYTKRVKKQTIASQNGPTQNAMPTPDQLRPQSSGRKKMAGQSLEDEGNEKMNPGGGQGGLGGHSQLRTVAIGQSAISEYIPNVEEGAFTALNSDQDIYYTFYARMNEQVRNRWVELVRNYIASRTAKQLQVLAQYNRYSIIEIVLTPDGEFNPSSAVENSSGDQTLDRVGIEAFRLAAPFGNPPKGMVKEDNLIRLRYGFMVQFRAPSMGGSNSM